MRPALVLLAVLPLGACSAADRLANIGERPELSAVGDPTKDPAYSQVSMAAPPAEPVKLQPNSLWRPGARAFFKDQRAARPGDVLTVKIDISDRAKVANTTARSRTNSESSGVDNLLGLENKVDALLPDGADPSKLFAMNSDGSSKGAGSVDRSEAINLTVAAIVTQVLPNGNLVIHGRQEVRVNYEVRELLVQGVVRPEDITNDNTVQHTQIAEARISYGGRGQLTDVQQPRYGQQVLDVLWPF